MHFGALKTIGRLALPVASIISLWMLSGCTSIEVTDRVVLQPAEVTLSPGDKPVLVTATWTSKTEGGKFERWEPPGGNEWLSIDFPGTGYSPTVFTVQTSSAQPIASQMHESTGTRTYTPCVGAVILRDEHEDYASDCLHVVIGFPQLLVTISGASSKLIDAQTRQVSATVNLEVVNAPPGSGFSLDTVFLSGQATICDASGKNCFARRLSSPTVTGKPAGPSTSAVMVMSQTVTAGSPDYIRKVNWKIQAVGISPAGARIESKVAMVQF